MATTYSVRVNGETVWTDKSKEYGGLAAFPEEYRCRPESGEVELLVNDEVIATQRTIEADLEARAAADLAAAEQEG